MFKEKSHFELSAHNFHYDNKAVGLLPVASECREMSHLDTFSVKMQIKLFSYFCKAKTFKKQDKLVSQSVDMM